MNDSLGKRNNLSLCRGPSGLKRVKSGQCLLENGIESQSSKNVSILKIASSSDWSFPSNTFAKETKPIQDDCQHVAKKLKILQTETALPCLSSTQGKERQNWPEGGQWDEEETWLEECQLEEITKVNEPTIPVKSFIRNGFPNESMEPPHSQAKDLQEYLPNKENALKSMETSAGIFCSTQANLNKPSDVGIVNELTATPLSPILGVSKIRTLTPETKMASTSSTNTFSILGDNLNNTRIFDQSKHNQWGVWGTGRVNLNLTGEVEKQTIAAKMMDRFKLNFMNQDFVKPLIMTANSQSIEMALCEAALINDIDSQFGCTFYGLPPFVKALLEKYKGIKDLYDWQKECLNLEAIHRRKNLIYSLPTSGGKTLVAEILIWREVLCLEKDVILVLPYVSIVQEKMRAMNNFAVDLNFNLEEYSGSKGIFPPKKHRKKHCVYIATIEKAHTLVNSLLEQKRIGELGLVVVDELHMIGDSGGRGCILENLLTKLMYSTRNIMIIGMSATLGNINELQTFMDADVYQGNFRPVELKEYIKLADTIFTVNPESKTDEGFIQKFRVCDDLHKHYTPETRQQDPDCITGLVLEVVPHNSCLVFCPTKKNCESVAKLMCKIMPPSLKGHKIQEKLDLLDALRSEGNGEICHVLRRTIPYGVAYHHSGLTQEERCLLEEAYTAGTLACLCCTSTLAAGVNLPAKRWIAMRAK